MIFSDLALARRLEGTEAGASRAFAAARRQLQPHSEPEVLETGGVTAVFDQVGSPVTQAFGLGLWSPATRGLMAEIEEFFRSRRSAVDFEVSPLAGVETFQLLASRGYRPIELTSVMYQALPVAARPVDVAVRPMSPGEEELWSETALRGWIGDHPEFRDFLLESGRLLAHSAGTRAYFASIGGEPVATGVLRLHEGVALFGGAATVPEARGRGAQQALVAARLRDAAEAGCDLAMMCAAPGSASQRNAERNGFRIAYTRVKWQLAA
jgi:GNAT superfamily N-acetyltransferase